MVVNGGEVPSDQGVLELVGDVQDLLELDEFRHELLVALRRAVPADWVSLNDLGPDPSSTVVIVDPPIRDEALIGVFARLSHQNPLVDLYARTRDGRVLRFSDLVTREELHATELYQQVYRVLGVEYQIAFTLPHAKDRILGIALSRGTHDFTDGERDLLARARPFLIQAYRNAVRYSEALAARNGRSAVPRLEDVMALGLSRRQAEVLRLVAMGAADRDIASRLEISHRTVQKHLQSCYRQLGVTSRSRAAAAAWSTIDHAGLS